MASSSPITTPSEGRKKEEEIEKETKTRLKGKKSNKQQNENEMKKNREEKKEKKVQQKDGNEGFASKHCGVSIGTAHHDGKDWFYLDCQGKEQGPFTKEKIKSWLEHGFFKSNLQVRKGDESGFSPIVSRGDLFVLQQQQQQKQLQHEMDQLGPSTVDYHQSTQPQYEQQQLYQQLYQQYAHAYQQHFANYHHYYYPPLSENNLSHTYPNPLTQFNLNNHSNSDGIDSHSQQHPEQPQRSAVNCSSMRKRKRRGISDRCIFDTEAYQEKMRAVKKLKEEGKLPQAQSITLPHGKSKRLFFKKRKRDKKRKKFIREYVLNG